MDYVYYPDYLEHHGILGMKWGVRRYQNEDGSWTDAGKARRNKGAGQVLREIGLKSSKRAYDRASNKKYSNERNAENVEYAERRWASKAAQSKADYTTAKANLDKHMNSMTTKLIGANSYKIKKYNKQMDEANRQYLQSESRRMQLEAAAKRYRSNEEKYSAKASSLKESIIKQGNKYADKYGDKALDELNIGINFGRKPKNAFKTYEEFESAFSKAESVRDEAHDKFDSYMKKNNMFQPDEYGPVYKSEKDFENGNVDKTGTDLWNKYEKSEERLSKVLDRDWDF